MSAVFRGTLNSSKQSRIDNEQHDDMLEWVGGKFDPEAFDSAVATKAMKKGLPDWRKEEWI